MLSEILTDLAAESAELDALVAPLSASDWNLPTPAPGWTIAHQIAHLAWTDRAVILAATDMEAFAEVLTAAAQNPAGFVDDGAASVLTDGDVLNRWRNSRKELAAVLSVVSGRLPWFGPSMSPAMMATARLMETWAHGLDVHEALGVTPVPTARLRHVAYIGVRTMANGFLAHGLEAPTTPVKVELTAPDGTQWTFGVDGGDLITGPALDFCLLVTQRRHRADLALVPTGPVADQWLDVAQAFAGPAGAKRLPGIP